MSEDVACEPQTTGNTSAVRGPVKMWLSWELNPGLQITSRIPSHSATEPTRKVFAPTNVTPDGSQTKAPSCLPVLVYNRSIKYSENVIKTLTFIVIKYFNDLPF